VTYVHQAFEPYLKDTYGVVVYQEQVLAIGREIGDLSWEEVTGLRKAMSRSLGKEYFDANGGNKWKDVATAKGIPRETAEKMWDEICSFGLWAFNLAHSVAYGMVSYWCCWLKAHHPLEFAAATLDAESDPTRQVTVLRELAEEGVEYLPVDPNLSTDRWTVQRGDRPRLIGPLTAIKGIGPANVLTILDARKNGVELTPGLRKKLESPKTEIDSLYPISKAASPLMEKKKIETPRWDIKDVQPSVAQEVMIVGVVTKINPSNENAPIKVARRNGQKVYPEMALNMFVKDDTDEIFCKVHRNSYERIGKEIAAESRVGKSIYAIKGRPQAGDFRMIWVRAVRYLGEIDGKEKNPVLEQSG
jgi:hypothetical protein